MNLVARQYILLFSLILQQHSVLTDFSSLKWYLSDYLSGNPWNLITGNVYKRLGDSCERSVDCIHVNNSICVDGECRCQSDYYPSESDDVEDKKVCKLAPGYKEDCQKDSKLLCRFPFVCSSSGVCDCPPGFLSNNTHCIRNCKSGYTSVGSPELSGGGKCLPIRELGDSCTFHEQCTTRYGRCIQHKCQCILGTVRRNKQCVTIKQCPIGEVPMENGHPLICDRYTLKCPDGNYCLFAQFADQRGFCCPNLKMNCPVGTPLSYGCADCPYETHYCFSYTISGVHKQNLCCPNDCPRSQPVRHEDRCYPLVGHSAHCLVDQQCSSVQNSICAAGPIEEERTCQCPLDFSLIGRKCIRKSKLGGECITNDDCLIESNTICLEGLCQCALGFIPEPMHGGFNQSSTYVVEHCIAEPTCPSTKGLEKLGQTYEDCSGETYRCSEGKYCRRWHIDSIKQRQYSVCCPIPKSEEYEEICGKFGMTLLIENSLQNDSAQPIRCLLSMPIKIESLTAFETLPEAICPVESTCIYNPYTINEGICCKYPPPVTAPPTVKNNTFYKFLDFKFYPLNVIHQ